MFVGLSAWFIRNSIDIEIFGIDIFDDVSFRVFVVNW